uniref:Uncharacterized protein n=1 Tax=Arundo donax TaxID=35708 RepID=A0A0A9AV77_ARUDO
MCAYVMQLKQREMELLD